MDYQHFGVMLDYSRNAVGKPETVKRMIDALKKMDYNCMELYLEDTYELPDEPYFGYLRGRYSKAELQEIDAYARTQGIELIPCIQTLAHFTNLVKHKAYADIVDTNDILLVGSEKTYALFDKIFAFLAESFSSRLVNIGMDEAAMVGLGKYLQQNGYRNRYEILLEHLHRVAEIAKKYGFTCHMWSDMIFHLRNTGVTMEQLPDNVSLAFWHYSHYEEDFYSRRLAAHKELSGNNPVWFAGGAWTWHGFAPFNLASLDTSLPAMKAVLKNNIQNVIITMWGDDGNDCSPFSILPALYTIRCYGKEIFDMDIIKKGFEKLFGIPYDVFTLLDLPNVVPGQALNFDCPSKVLLYSDPFMGVFDDSAKNMPDVPYKEYADRILPYTTLPEYGYIFDTIYKLCRADELKYKLGVRTREAYLAGNKAELHRIANEDYPEILTRLEDFYHAFQKQWYKENKAFGFEVQDVRFGGLMLRLRSCRERLLTYLAGDTDKIEELEAEILPRDFSQVAFRHYSISVTVANL